MGTNTENANKLCVFKEKIYRGENVKMKDMPQMFARPCYNFIFGAVRKKRTA